MDGNKTYRKFDISTLSPEAQADYMQILEKIKTVSTGITISPIDVIIRKITEAGYTVAEVTGRKYELQINPKTNAAIVHTRKRINTNDAFRKFNNNEVDVLLINQSGSTGASAHAIITPKVSEKEVKQRVMIVLQAELDINTEVQKRGRINRTGQLFKPIYDYVNSAIPAEKRLMMMLQKKLKSLDANTTSNQKSSTKILDVPDFLNKYGDEIVTDYLKENIDVNILLDDPIGVLAGERNSSETEDAAFKVSGRVAVLSTAMQQDFYNEISTRYNEYVEYLKQIGDYDLEVEAMHLQAETVSSKTIIVGKGGKSEFGDDSILEVVMANVLKKPFSASELNNLLTEALQGKNTKVFQQEILSEYEAFISSSREKELAENMAHYQELIKGVPTEFKLKKILNKDGHDAYEAAIDTRTKELQAAQVAAEEKIRKSYAGKNQYIEGLFSFFYVGRNLNYPVVSFDSGQELVPAVFLGFLIDRKKKNPYAPSALRLRFAIANSTKYVTLPASYSPNITAIKGASVSLPELEKEYVIARWEEAIKESSIDRKHRHIITGNLLQAFGTYKGKLISFTTKDGGTRKGILMPENWNPGGEAQQKTEVPVLKALKVIRSMSVGQQITTSNSVSIFKQPGKFKLIVSSARSRSGDVYLDLDILQIVDNNNFEKIADKMMATLDEDKIDRFINILQEKFNASVSLSPVQYDIIKGELSIRTASVQKQFPKIQIPLKPKPEGDEANELELEAMALELELELLNFAA